MCGELLLRLLRAGFCRDHTNLWTTSSCGPILKNLRGLEQSDFLPDSEFRAMERANLIAALRHADWGVWGPQGAGALLALKPSTLSYRMKVLGIRKDL